MKHILTILLFSICLSIFGQTDTICVSQQDTVFYKKKITYYEVVVPKGNGYKLVVPKRNVSTEKDSVYSNGYETSQAPEIITDYDTEIKRLQRKNNEHLTYNQIKYLQALPYLK